MQTIKNLLLKIRSKIPTKQISHLSTKCNFFIPIMRKVTGIQLSTEQILKITKAIKSVKNCKVLVFGLGNDTPYWHYLSKNTLFIEDNQEWIDIVNNKIKVNTQIVKYKTKLADYKTLDAIIDSETLLLKINGEYDVIIVDAPMGYATDNPGRMSSIYTASKLIKPNGTIFVHDCERPAEDIWSKKIFGNNFSDIGMPILREYVTNTNS